LYILAKADILKQKTYMNKTSPEKAIKMLLMYLTRFNESNRLVSALIWLGKGISMNYEEYEMQCKLQQEKNYNYLELFERDLMESIRDTGRLWG